MTRDINDEKTLHKLKELSEMTYEKYTSDSQLIDEIVGRWTRLRLLEGVSENVVEELAYCYEKMAAYLIYDKDLVEADEQFETAVFPMIRRVLTNVGTLNGVFEPKEFETLYYDNIDECNKAAKEKGAADEEAEALCLLCDNYVEKLK